MSGFLGSQCSGRRMFSLRTVVMRIGGRSRLLSGSTIYVKNSLTKTKEPLRPAGEDITWYMCGPTVYDHAHMGHARTYTSFDILYRLLTDYFGHRVSLVMGMTDIDDKIINRAKERGVSHTTLARKFEADFMEDMESLNVRPPSTYLRVSEHIPEIIQYIQGIERKGLAYTIDGWEGGGEGGVYFDVARFTAEGNEYGKLKSGIADNTENARAQAPTSKRSAVDFALWKAAKAGEPEWPSPFGSGRPGWHIECSAMCSTIFGSKLDIHTGGIDLAFPHHCNEIAQCEAHNGHDWATHFLHSGHLHIEGLKMSKSLKNFITIKEFLELWSADSFRVLCLKHRYNANFDYGSEGMIEATRVLKRFEDFFEVVQRGVEEKTVKKETEAGKHEKDESNGVSSWNVPSDVPVAKWSQEHHQLQQSFLRAQQQVDQQLRDDFDTPAALATLLELVRACWPFAADPRCQFLVRTVRNYISRMLSLFGLRFHKQRKHHLAEEEAKEEASALRVLEILSDFRSELRNLALVSLKTRVDLDSKEILRVCDRLRDQVLPDIGVELKDHAEHESVLRLLTRSEMTAHNLKTETLGKQRAAQRSAQRASPGEIVTPEQLFRSLPKQYSLFDAQDVPTHDHEGRAFGKSARKKLGKKMQKHRGKFLAQQEKRK